MNYFKCRVCGQGRVGRTHAEVHFPDTPASHFAHWMTSAEYDRYRHNVMSDLHSTCLRVLDHIEGIVPERQMPTTERLLRGRLTELAEHLS